MFAHNGKSKSQEIKRPQGKPSGKPVTGSLTGIDKLSPSETTKPSKPSQKPSEGK